MFIPISIFTAIIAAIAFAAFKFYQIPRGTSSKKFIDIPVGHRGCRFLKIPENSLSAFKKAIEHGCTAVELDCRLSADGHVIVIHDDTIRRVCTTDQVNGKKYISDMTLAEIKTLKYKDWNSSETIPTLQEVFDLCVAHDVKVFVELKCLTITEAIELPIKVVNVFNAYKAWEFACIITFHPLAVYNVRKLQPLIETCILYCHDFYQYGVKNNCEKQHTFIVLFARILDLILINIASTVVPKITGCTMIGPDITQFSKDQIVHYQQNLELDIYCWVANTTHEMDFFLNQNCSVGTDFIFPQYVPVDTINCTLRQPKVAAAKTIMTEYPQRTINASPIHVKQVNIDKFVSSAKIIAPTIERVTERLKLD